MQRDYRVVFPTFEAKVDSSSEAGPDPAAYARDFFFGRSLIGDVTPGGGRDRSRFCSGPLTPDVDDDLNGLRARAGLHGRAHWQQLGQ